MAPVSKAKVPISVHDFTVLPLRLPAQPSFSKPSTHYLYLRANAPKVPTADTPRELFLVNVPIDATELHIRQLSATHLGGARIESVAFEGARVGKGITAPVAPSKKRKRGNDDDGAADGKDVGVLPPIWDRDLRRSGDTAIATFVDKASAELALKAAKKIAKARTELPWGSGGVEDNVPALGSSRYLTHHRLRFPPHEELQASVDAFMTAFSAREAEAARLLARQRAEPDEDGFVTVVRGGRSGPAREEEVRAKEAELKEREKNRIMDNFYRFQVREKRKEEAKELVRGFEEDRRKVDEMRRRRGKMKPE